VCAEPLPSNDRRIHIHVQTGDKEKKREKREKVIKRKGDTKSEREEHGKKGIKNENFSQMQFHSTSLPLSNNKLVVLEIILLLAPLHNHTSSYLQLSNHRQAI
jgi:hypothetical protein